MMLKSYGLILASLMIATAVQADVTITWEAPTQGQPGVIIDGKFVSPEGTDPVPIAEEDLLKYTIYKLELDGTLTKIVDAPGNSSGITITDHDSPACIRINATHVSAPYNPSNLADMLCGPDCHGEYP